MLCLLNLQCGCENSECVPGLCRVLLKNLGEIQGRCVSAVCHVQKYWRQSAVGAGKVFQAGEVIAESFAKRKKRGELSLFRLANWKQKEDLIDVCRCQTQRRETKLSRCWLRLNESRLAMGTVRLEIKRRLLSSTAAWNRSFWTSLSSEEQREEPLSPWCPEHRAGQSLKWCQWSGACIAGPCYCQSFLGSSFTWIPLCFIVWVVCNRKPLPLSW